MEVTFRISDTLAATVTQRGISGDAGPATIARLSNPDGLALDGAGNIYVADTEFTESESWFPRVRSPRAFFPHATTRT